MGPHFVANCDGPHVSYRYTTYPWLATQVQGLAPSYDVASGPTSFGGWESTCAPTMCSQAQLKPGSGSV